MKLSYMMAFLLIRGLFVEGIAENKTPTERENKRPNILFIIVDDLNTRLSCYGDDVSQTPSIDQLAREGVLFKNCFTQFPTCGPSRMSMLSGLYPFQTGVVKNQKTFKKENINFTTLPALFRKKGYTTARVGKVFHMGIPKGIGKAGADDINAWDYSINNSGWDGIAENFLKADRFGSFKNPGVAISTFAPRIKSSEMADGVGTTEAIKLMKKLNPKTSGKPFMLFMGYYRPHPPMISPESSWKNINPDNIKIPNSSPKERLNIPSVNFHLLNKDFNFIPNSVARRYTHAYYAAINFIDKEIGLLIQGLKENALSKNTIIVFTSDQGFHLGEHGHWHKSTFYENACNIPLIIVDPRSNINGKESTSICGLIDIYPTLCEMAEIKPEHVLSGKSVASVFTNKVFRGKEFEITQGSPSGISLRTKHFRYTEWSNENKDAMLFDLQKDPQEKNNLINTEKYAPIKLLLQRKLQLFIK